MNLCKAIYLFLVLSASVSIAQDQSWKAYEGKHFSFRYPDTFQFRELSENDVSVSPEGVLLNVEFAVSLAVPKDKAEMALNAQKHMSNFAAMNHMQITFDKWREVEGGAVLVVSHLRSATAVLDAAATIQATDGRVVLLQVMFEPSIAKQATEIAAQIGSTFRLGN
jgi:hypothetical protein